MAALWILCKQPKGQSALTLADDLGCEHGSALHLAHRIRVATVSDKPLLMGPIQVDEVYLGGRERNKPASKKLSSGLGTVGKTPVVGSPVVGSYDEASRSLAPRSLAPRSLAPRSLAPMTRLPTGSGLEALSSVNGLTVRMYFSNLVLPGTVVHTDQAAVYAEVPGHRAEVGESLQRSVLKVSTDGMA